MSTLFWYKTQNDCGIHYRNLFWRLKLKHMNYKKVREKRYAKDSVKYSFRIPA